MIDDRLLKIVALAKYGIDGEKTAAIAAVKRVCKQQNLNFDDVMGQTDEREYVLDISWRSKDEFEMLGQVCFKFAIPDGGDLHFNDYRKVYMYVTTLARHIEASNAAAVYLAEYRKQKKRMMADFSGAFIHKNRLYRPTPEDAPKSPPQTLEQRQAAWRQAQLMDAIDHVKVNKAIGG